MLPRKMLIGGLILLGLSLMVSACQSSTVSPTRAVATFTPAPATAVPPTSTATAVPERSLVVCLGQEPQTLYPYASSARSMWSVLEAIYDGPIDNRQYSAQPVILEKLPSLADGDARLQPVTVKAGDEVVDADGNLSVLSAGVKVFPSGCSSTGCAVQYDGSSAIQVDQMVVTFKLKAGLQWSDGAPLTAADSVFSYNIAASPDTPSSKRLSDRTSEYKAVDAQTVQWTGKPGFLYNRYFTNFWLPLPEHLWKDKSAADLLSSEEAATKPIGWGPYVIQEWIKGDHITLKKNPAYFRAAEGLPVFDNLVFRFIGEQGSSALAALQTGECDVLDQTTLLDQQLEKVVDLQKAGKLKAAIGQGPEWEHIEFGIRPVSYDDPTNLPANRRPDFFADLRVRQAFAYCLDRQTVIGKTLNGQANVPDGYLPPDHPWLAKDLASYPYDPAKGSALLDEAGWKDDDNNPATPRKAMGAANVPDGTPLEVNYLTTQAALRVNIANALAETVKGCGIQLNVQPVTPDELYAPGPDGPLFGRKFDLAQFSWQADSQMACYLYETSQIPTAANHWVGANVSGYSNPDLDSACQAAAQALPDQASSSGKQSDAIQRLFAQDLPSIPLYFPLKIAAARPDFCGLEMDVTARSALWNLESYNYGEGCK